MQILIIFVLTFILTLSGCSSSVPNTETTNNFKVQSFTNISAGDIKAYYENDTEETFSPPAVDDNDGFLEPDDLDLFIQKLEAITALDLIKDSGFKTKSISPAKELRKTQLLAQMESDERVRLFSDLDTLDSQLITFTNEIDKLSQTRYFIGKPKGEIQKDVFNNYKLKIDELKTEFDYLVESENTYSLVDAGANLAKQIQMYMFLIRDYADTKVADEVTNLQELSQFQGESDYFDKIQDTTTLIRFLQKNIQDSKNKIVSENDKLTIEYQRIDAEIALFNQGLIDVNNEIENIKTHLTPQEIEEVESEFQISSFSIQGARGKVLTELGKITIKYGDKGYKWGLRETKKLAKRFQKEIDDFLNEKKDITKNNCSPKIWTKGKYNNSVKNMFEHWNKHKSEFPELKNSVEYVKKAKDFLDKPPIGSLSKIREKDKVKILYDPNNNIILFAEKTGQIKTMFKPKTGIGYYNGIK